MKSKIITGFIVFLLVLTVVLVLTYTTPKGNGEGNSQDTVLLRDGFTSAYLIVADQGNLSYEVDDCFDNGSLGGCFAINWSEGIGQVNWSDNVTIHSGDFSWNFTEENIQPVGIWLFNFSNNGTTNFTVSIILNGTVPSLWQVFKDNHTVNLSNSAWSVLCNVTSNTSELVNLTFDLYNISEQYINWTEQNNSFSWGFNFSVNVTKY